MRKIYLLILLFITTTVMAQTPIITMVMSGNCTGQTPKMIEIYAQGTVDFTEYSLQKQVDASASWVSTFDLSPLGTVTDDFVYIYKTSPTFATEFPNVDPSRTLTTVSVIDVNGDDGLRIIHTTSATVIDEFGENGVDGTGEPWEYVRGYVKRLNNTGPDVIFNMANWSGHNMALDGLCGTSTYEVITNAHSFTYTTDPTIFTSVATEAGFLQFLGTPSAERSVDISAINLTADVDVEVTTGDYEISLTAGGPYTATLTVPHVSGSIAVTPIFIRLNGLALADPSNGELTMTSAGATDKVVVLQGEITALVPTVTVSKPSITGFSHFVGTPSAVDSFNVAGFNLIADITLTAPTNFEISDVLGGTYGSNVTIPFGTGTVASTKVYVRLNGPVLNLAQAGDITVSSTDATDMIVALAGQTLDYVVSTIGAVTNIDANGVGTSIDAYVTLTGIVHCDDFRNTGYDVVIIDDNNDGITMFKTTNVDGYSPTEGDKITVQGKIQQFNGLLQLSPETIVLDAASQTLQIPTSVTVLSEATESQYIKLDSVTLVNSETVWTGNSSFAVSNGTTTVTVRVPNDSPLAGTAIPNGPISIIGVGKQFDSSSPYDSGYQMFPCGVVSLCNVNAATSLTDATITATSTTTGLTYKWVNCADTSVIAGETSAAFTASVSGDYAVIITDGACVEMSACVSVNIVGLSDNGFAGVFVFPNPVNDVLNITNENGMLESVEVISATGSVVYVSTVTSNNVAINTAQLGAGIYFVNVRIANSIKTFKVIK